MSFSQELLLKPFRKTKGESNGSQNLKTCAETHTKHSCNPSENIFENILKKKLNRNGLLFAMFFTFVIMILSILTIYCFFVEYRLSNLAKKFHQFESQRMLLEKRVNKLLKETKEKDQLLQRMTSYKASKISADKDSASNLSSANSVISSIKKSISINDERDNIDDNIKKEIYIPRNDSTAIKILRKRSKRAATNGKGQANKSQNRTSTNKKERKSPPLPLIHLENNSTLMRQKQSEAGTSFNFWKEPYWVTRKIKQKRFHLDAMSGHVNVEEEGVYLVYLQVVYHDAIGRWSTGIVVNGEVRAKCMESEQLRDIENYIPDKHGVYKQCSLTTVIHLRPKQSVSIKCMYGQRTILSQPEFTYWGMVKLA